MKNTLDETKDIKLLISQVSTLRSTVHDTLNNASMKEAQRYVSFKPFATMYNRLAEKAKSVLKVSTDFYHFNTDKMGNHMETLWGAQKQIMEQVYLCSGLLLSALEESMNFVNDEAENISDYFQSRLRYAIYYFGK